MFVLLQNLDLLPDSLIKFMTVALVIQITVGSNDCFEFSLNVSYLLVGSCDVSINALELFIE